VARASCSKVSESTVCADMKTLRFLACKPLKDLLCNWICRRLCYGMTDVIILSLLLKGQPFTTRDFII